MGLVADVAQSVAVTVHRSGSMELSAFGGLVTFLGAARSLGICVLGLEGFRVSDGHVVPVMDAIADLSSLDRSAGCDGTIAEALRFLSSLGETDLLFDVSLEKTPSVSGECAREAPDLRT